MIALGAALITLVAVESGTADSASRVVQGVLAGIGFLGAGAIDLLSRLLPLL